MSSSIPATPCLPLRSWQSEALLASEAALLAGKRAVVSAVMGSGKTVLVAELLRRRLLAGQPDKSVIVVTTPTMALVSQIAEVLCSWLGGPGMVGCYYTHAKEADAPVVVACNASAPALGEVLARAGRKVSLWVADEAHKTQAPSMLAAAAALSPACALAMTATPYRSTSMERLQLWDEVVFEYGPKAALQDGVIVPWKVVPWTKDETSLDAACFDLIYQFGQGPGIVSAYTIKDAVAFASCLTEGGIPAAAIHSELPVEQRRSLLDALRSGTLRCLVHVSLLAEGIDLPWLRWLCLRRAVGARVRFVQEVGRVLRAAPGKVAATILDPHDLFGTLELSYEAALGWAPVAPVGQDGRTGAGSALDQQRVATPVSDLERWLRALYLAGKEDGLCRPATTIASRAWRSRPVGLRQVALLKKVAEAANYIADPVGRQVAFVASNALLAHSGPASDLIELLCSLRTAARKQQAGWRWAVEVDIPPPSKRDVLLLREEVTEGDGRIYAAAALRRDKATGRAAFGWRIVLGRRVLAEGCREALQNERFGDGLRLAVELASEHANQTVPPRDIVLPASEYLPRWARSLPVVPQGEHRAAGGAWAMAARGLKELQRAAG